MQQRNRIQRASVVWLIMIGLVLSIVFFSGAAPIALEIALAAIYAVLALAVLVLPFLPDARSAIANAIPNPAEIRARRVVQPTRTASVAESRARRFPDYRDLYRTVDIGLLHNERGRDGLLLQKARLVSLDDHAIQPYIVLHSTEERAEQTVLVRFEITDQTGKVQFVCEDEAYIYEGENAVLASYQMPLRSNDKLGGSGTWDMRVLVNGALVAMHSFGVGPSLEERRRYISGEGQARQDRLGDTAYFDEDGDDLPVSLEELLRGQRRSD